MIHSHILYDDVTETSTRTDANCDRNTMQLGLPYARDFVLRNEILNPSKYVLDDVDTLFTLELDNQAEGFHTKAVRIHTDLINNYQNLEKITLTGLNKKTAVLEYDAAAKKFTYKGTEVGRFENGEWVLDTLEGFDLAKMTSLCLTGKKFAYTGDPADEGKRYYVDFYGYEDSPIGSYNYHKAESTHYLDGVRDNADYALQHKDDVMVYMSKLYFDTVIVAGYNDNTPDKKFDRVSTPLEDVREGSDCAPAWRDNSELEIGYKALGSFMVDFRQYMNVGSNLPEGANRQEHERWSYVKEQSLNTAADVEITVNLPYEYFDTYYLKLDPRVKGYLNSLTVTRKNGAQETFAAQELLWGAEEQDAQGNPFCRLNLLQADSENRFTDDRAEFYKAPKGYEKPVNPVMQVTFNLKINQEQNHEEDGVMVANRPDYGTWYKDSDESSKYMFEITGRFYKMEASPAGNGQVYATADTKLTIGGEQGKERVETSKGYDSKSDWSYHNDYEYRYKVCDRYSCWCTWTYRPFSAGNLFSKTYVHVQRDSVNMYKGATTVPSNQSNTDAYFGLDNQYVVSFQRGGTSDGYFETTGSMGKDWWGEYEDMSDWSSKIGYGDEIILRDTMPTIRPHELYGYYGFLSTGLTLKPAITNYMDTIVLQVADVDETGKQTNPYTITINVDALKSTDDGKTLTFVYGKEAPGVGGNPEPAVQDGQLLLGPGQFVLSYDIHLKNMMGNGEYTKELGQLGQPDFNGGANDIDLIVHGRPYVISGKDSAADGTNAITGINKVDYEPETEYTNYTDDAVLMGFMIRMVPGYRLDHINPEQNITEYQANNTDPTVAEFGVQVWNEPNTGSNEGRNMRARIDSAVISNDMNENYRLQKIYIPKMFVDGNWFRATELLLTINEKEHLVPLTADLMTSAKHPDCYEVDVEQIIRDNLAKGYATEYSNRQTDFVKYLMAHVTSFRLTFAAVDPQMEHPDTVLDQGQYLTADKKEGYTYWYDGVYVDRTEEEFKQNVWTEDSTPTFGKVPNLTTGESMYNRIAGEVTSIDVNADTYHKPTATGTQLKDYYTLRNLSAVLDFSVTRDRTAQMSNGFAYDHGDVSQSPVEVDRNHLLPYDYVDYTVTIRNTDAADIALNCPTLHFAAPEGQQIVKWEFVSATDAAIDAKNLHGTMKNDDGEIAAENGQDYSLDAKEQDALYRELAVKLDSRLGVGQSVVLRVTTQLLPEPADSYEGKTIHSDVWVTAEHTHSYPQYAIFYKNGGTGYQHYSDDAAGRTDYYRNVTGTSEEVPVYEGRAQNTLTYYRNRNRLSVSYAFDDQGYTYDNQKAKIHVTGMKNDTGHDLESLIATISFLDEKGMQGFALTQAPIIGYPDTLPQDAKRAAVKIEYCLGEDNWQEAPAGATEEFFRSAQKIRWTYDRVNAHTTDGRDPIFGDVDLIGVGLYQDIREDTSTAAMAETFYFQGSAEVAHVHHHKEDKTIAGNQSAVLDRTITMTGSSTYDQTIYRENPEVEFYTQVFETAEQAETAGLNKDASQKRGYRPGETMWQKLTLRNKHMVNSSGAQNADQGVILNPVFYDKLPEYLSSADLANGKFHVVWKDKDGSPKKDMPTLQVVDTRTVTERDYGGWMNYPKSQEYNLSYGKPFDDLTPSKENTQEIDFTVYELRFAKQGEQDVRMEVGDTIEIWYAVTARNDDLPMVYVDEDRDLTTANDQHPAYFPRMGEYYFHYNSYATPLLPSLSWSSDKNKVENEQRQMDLDYLLHDIGFSADKNEQVDRWEFLNGSQTMIPGSGTNGVLFDEDINEVRDHQTAVYQAKRQLTGKADRDQLPTEQNLKNSFDGSTRDWWSKVLSLRTELSQKWDGTKEVRTPVLWSQTRQHLQKAWMLTASEMTSLSGNRQYEVTKGDGYTENTGGNPAYNGGAYYEWLRKVTDDNYVTALEYSEDFDITLHAVNYGDWGLDGVEFIYTMPYGVEPQVKGDNYGVSAQCLNKVNGPNDEVYTDVSDISVEVLQSPETGSKGYPAPNQPQDPLWTDRTEVDAAHYDADKAVPWVFKITVRSPLQKWFNRGTEAGYKMKVQLPAHVFLTNENEFWYDRVIARPYVAPDSRNHQYYQIFDINHWEGETRTRMPHNQIYGMDYVWNYGYYNSGLHYSFASPNTLYINGYNIQNNEVQRGDADTVGTVTNNGYTQYAKADKQDLYAQTGTRAVMRKPFVRLWATVGDDLTGATHRQYYTDTEGQINKINIHVENKYWWDQYAPNGESGRGYEKYRHNYEVDGGSRGTLVLPVITNVLPLGITPVAADGSLYSPDNAANAQKTLDWTLYERDLHPGADVKNITEAPAAEKAKYAVQVTYEQIPCYDGDKLMERTEGRYVIRFTPTMEAVDDAEQEVRLASEEAAIFSVKTITERVPRVETDRRGIQGDLHKNYQDNRTYLGSKLPGFKYVVDEDIQGNNPYFVGSYGQAVGYDNRLDAVRHGGYAGNLPDDKLNHAYEKDTPLIGSLRKYLETDTQNVEDYCAANGKEDLNYEARLPDGLKDFDRSGSFTHVEAATGQSFNDSGVMNTLKIRVASPRFSVDAFAGPSKEAAGEGTQDQTFQYGDDIWYSAKIYNSPSDELAFQETGSLYHAKMVVSFHLPESVSYSGTAGWSVENNDKDIYNNPNDYYVEYTDPATGETLCLTEQQMREQGWGVEVIADTGTQWDSETLQHPGQIVTFEITTPKTDGFTDYSSYVKGEKPAGYFPSGAVMNFKIRTRVDNLPHLNRLADPHGAEVWDSEKNRAEVFMTIHDSDGQFALRDNGTFINRDQQETETPSEGKYNGFTIAVDGHYFHAQGQESCVWNANPQISDQRGDNDVLITDYTADGQYDTRHVKATSGKSLLKKPAGTVRLDTGKLRPQVNDPDSDHAITEDPHVRSSYVMPIRLDQAVNKTANVNTFVVNYNVPYYGTNVGTPDPAPASENGRLEQTVKEIRTGCWEVPADLDAETAAILQEHLKVYVYILTLENPPAENGVYYYPGANDYASAAPGEINGWRILGSENGYGLTENVQLSVPAEYEKNVYQIRWVIKTEPFTADGVSYNEEQAPIYYPVPVGFRLDVDADPMQDGKQEMDDWDPNHLNKDEPSQDVKDRSAQVLLQTAKLDIAGMYKHTNHFATLYPKYDDQKYAVVSARTRAGFYVDPELPTVDLTIKTKYFSGNYSQGYTWKLSNNVSPNTSKMLKYQVEYKNISHAMDPEVLEDNVTDPLLTVALPYVAVLKKENFGYVPYRDMSAAEAKAEDYYIGDNYGNSSEDAYKVNQNLDDKKPLWTWYVIDEDGNRLSAEDVKYTLRSVGEPRFNRKSIDGSTNMRTIVNFPFEGKLAPGQEVVVELMVPFEEAEGNAVPTDMLQCKAYGFKVGNFDPYVKQGGAYDNLNYEYDAYDVNDNGSQKDMGITRLTNALIFQTVESIVQRKMATTELESNVTGRAVPVPEGKNYEYNVSMVNKSGKTSYDKLVLYDVLPYAGDMEIKNLDSNTHQPIPRHSKWNGWILPDSLQVMAYAHSDGATTEVPLDPSQYEIWVGPLAKSSSGKFEVRELEALPKQEELALQETYDNMRGDGAKTEHCLVRLNEVLQMPDGPDKEAAIKGIRAVWVELDPSYKLTPNSRLRLTFQMHEPLNLPVYPGDVSAETPEQYNEMVKEYSAWNTFVSRCNANILENARVGVYPDAPAGRGYIGSYVWNDADYSGVPDSGEGTYGTETNTGRIQLQEKTTDLDFDGELDDPGINGVVVQLLNPNGYPVNREGQTITKVEDEYVLADPQTGEPLLIENPDGLAVYQNSKFGGPVEYVTESDYYGKDGYYILSDLKPGDYRLRFVFPENYRQYSVTTRQLGADKATGVTVFRDGAPIYGNASMPSGNPVPVDRLTVLTDVISVEAVNTANLQAYDQKVTAYNVGVGRAYPYGGTVWLDETDVSGSIKSNGKIDDGEKTLSDIRVSVYDMEDLTTPCLDADGNPAVYTTRDDGDYLFRLKPGRKYLVQAEDALSERLLKPTPWTFTNDPTQADQDNDLSSVAGKHETKAFAVKMPVDASGKPVLGADGQSFKANTSIDLGYINAGRGFLGKFVWDDLNYDGIMDANEPGIPGVTLTLEGYYLDENGAWQLFETRDIQTNDAGAYVFENVMSYRDVAGSKCLTGYRLKIDPQKNAEHYQTYAITHYLAGKGVKDSDLISDPKSENQYYLNQDYIIIAQDATKSTDVQYRRSYGGKDYDISDAKIILDYDAGFARYEYGQVDGMIWSDNGANEHRYNGVWDTDEQGFANVAVYLEQYYRASDGSYQKVSGGVAANGTSQGAFMKTLTDSQGKYHFEMVPLFVEIDGVKMLSYYRIRAEVPGQSYAVTRYRQAVSEEQTNSDWITNQYGAASENYLTTPQEDYFLLAKPAGKLQNGPYTLSHGHKAYDIVHKAGDVTGYDGGLLPFVPAKLEGILWKDTNYDGIRDSGETGYAGQTVQLERYYYGEGGWVRDHDFAASAQTDGTGAYQFEGLSTYVAVNGKYYLAGYRLHLESLPENMAVTRYMQGDDRTVDSDLLPEDLALVRADEYLILAKEAVANTTGGAYNYTMCEVNDTYHNKKYDLLTPQDVSGQDGGVVELPKDTVTGRIWEDANYNGLQDTDERGIAGEEVQLERYYYHNDQWNKDAGFKMSTLTDVNGNYTFSGLTTYAMVDGKAYLASYKLHLAAMPEIYGATLCRVGDDRTVDSDLDGHDLSLQRSEEYLILADTAKPNDDGASYPFTAVEVDGALYDMLTSKTIGHNDGGLVPSNRGKLQGIIWNDADYDGIREENEQGVADISVTLEFWYFDAAAKVWKVYPDFTKVTVPTNENGVYTFTDLRSYAPIDGENRVLGYRVKVEAVPEAYGITYYRVGENRSVDSDLQAENLSLVRENEYLLLVNEAADSDYSGNVAIQNADGQDVTYDVTSVKTMVNGQDGGLVAFPKASITGRIWEDANYNGVQNQDEHGIANVTVALKSYYYDGTWHDADGFNFPTTTVTNADGIYTFTDLPPMWRSMV